MVEPAARIRRFELRDEKLVKFIIGRSHMEGLAAANIRMYTNPLILSAWVGLSTLFMQYMHWWPEVEKHGYTSYLRPLPAFASVAVPILLLIDWFNRGDFEALSAATLRWVDVADLDAFYGSNSPSDLWILENGDKFVGLIAVDASQGLNKPDPVFPAIKTSPRIATVRHLFVEEPYRSTGVAADLLQHGVKQAFGSNENLEEIRASETSLLPYIGKALKETGFSVVEGVHREVGLLRWRMRLCLLSEVPLQNQPLLLLQSSLAQSALPVLSELLQGCSQTAECQTILVNLLYPPSHLLLDPGDAVTVLDYTDHVPGYDEKYTAPAEEILKAISSAGPGPLNVCIDSLNTLLEDSNSVQEAHASIQKVYSTLRSRPGRNRLILHGVAPCPLFSRLSDTSFTSSINYIIAHPPIILQHLTTAYSTPPPPLTPPAKFWSIFIPFSNRFYESRQLVYGPKGEGCSNTGQIALEIIVRGVADKTGRRKAIERQLEGYRSDGGACELLELDVVKPLASKTPAATITVDPTQNLSFSLSLTSAQQESRAEVPLPYAHEGKSFDQSQSQQGDGSIYYDPDSADDLDDDDPDEDLDI